MTATVFQIVDKLKKVKLPLDQQLHLAALRGDQVSLTDTLDSRLVPVDCRDKEGTTALILASANGHTVCVKELLDRGANPLAKRVTGTNALFFAAQGGYIGVAKLLIEAGVPVDRTCYEGSTALCAAVIADNIPMVKFLQCCDADINVRMADGASPIFLAAQNGSLNMTRHLIHSGADVNSVRLDGVTPLFISCQNGHADITRELLYSGANTDQAREDGTTALFKAAHKGHMGCVEALLRYQPDLGLLENGSTALHGAVMFMHTTVIRLLLAAGADFSVADKDGVCPLELAEDRGLHEVVELLKSQGATCRPHNRRLSQPLVNRSMSPSISED